MAWLWNVTPSHLRGGHWRIGYGQGRHFPQCAALHLRDGYLRLAPGTGWGTSVILPPSFWKRGRLYHGAPVSARYERIDNNLELALTTWRGGLTTRLKVTLMPPDGRSLKVRVVAETQGEIPLDERAGEAFKPVTLSSMWVHSTKWDTDAFMVNKHITPFGEELGQETSGWFVAPCTALKQRLGLRGGSSQWKADAPTITVDLQQPLAVAGWHTHSVNPDDDNIALWATAPAILPSWSYTITASGA